MDTVEYLRKVADHNARQFEQEATHLFHAWGHDDATPGALKELSTVAADYGDRLRKIAGDALEMAEQLDPTPIGFDHIAASRARLWLVKREEIAAEVAAGEHAEEAL